jgi:hypothetical protein
VHVEMRRPCNRTFAARHIDNAARNSLGPTPQVRRSERSSLAFVSLGCWSAEQGVSNRSPPDDAIAVFLSICLVPTHCGLDGACLTEDHRAEARLDRHPQRPVRFLPLRAEAPIPRDDQESLPFGRPPLRFGLSGAGRSSPVLSTAIEAAVGAARTTEKGYDNGNYRLFHRFRQRL